MKRHQKVIFGMMITVLIALAIALPVFARGDRGWWKETVNVALTAYLEPYKDSYWASLLFPSNLTCNSATLTINAGQSDQVIYTGKIYTFWWFLRRCGITFENVVPNYYPTKLYKEALLTVRYQANGIDEKTYQKTIYIGKTILFNTIYVKQVYLPWYNSLTGN